VKTTAGDAGSERPEVACARLGRTLVSMTSYRARFGAFVTFTDDGGLQARFRPGRPSRNILSTSARQ
jgi:hypothetical protein